MVFGLTNLVAFITAPWTFNSLWELDGVRTYGAELAQVKQFYSFNSPWELDGVRTLEKVQTYEKDNFGFQFPLGIRWCSDF